jgi:hypothetical protein
VVAKRFRYVPMEKEGDVCSVNAAEDCSSVKHSVT